MSADAIITCTRCGASYHRLSPPHLCADVKRRYERRVAQTEAVSALIREALPGVMYNEDRQALAEKIVAKLANMGVQND